MSAIGEDLQWRRLHEIRYRHQERRGSRTQVEPDVDETDIAVKVKDGEVTISGYARSYFEKNQAEAAVKRVKGVAAVANDLEVRWISGAPTDPEIAARAACGSEVRVAPELENIKTVVHQGRLTLEGTTEWHYQRERAESAVRRLDGVMSVLNHIRIEPEAAADNIKHRIESAFRRIAQVDAGRIMWKRTAATSLCAARFARGQSTIRPSRLPGQLPELPK